MARGGAAPVATGPERDATVKWFNKEKGFGFVSNDEGDDVFMHRDALPDDARRYYAGRLGTATRTPEGLRALLQQLFEWPVQVQEFIAEWMRLPADAHLQLGLGPRNARLGVDSVVGAHVRGAHAEGGDTA